MKNRYKLSKGYISIKNTSKTNNFFEKFILRNILLILFIVLFLMFIFFLISIKYKFKFLDYLKIRLKRDYLNEITEPQEIIYQSFPLSKISNDELKDIKKFLANDKLINPVEIFKKEENPKISIIIPLYNGEKYIQKSILSIQNQNLKEIEIIIVDDFSNDNSVNLVQKLMEKDQRIVLFKNEQNKGLLNAKITGISNSKGKYALFMLQNDFFVQNNVFNILYEEVEKDNLDILGFSSLLNEGKYIHHFNEISLIKEKSLDILMYNRTKDSINRTGDVIYNYLVKGEILKKIISQIEDKYINKVKMNYNSDFFLLYLLSKNTATFKQINKIIYFSSHDWNKKWDETDLNLRCLNYLNYIDFLYNKTEDNYEDKKLVIYELKNWILNTKCRKCEIIRNDLVEICNQIAEKSYVEDIYKKELFLFMFENVTIISPL